MSHLVAPSILSCDFAYVARDVEMINSSAADWLHVDVMDGVYVPNISFGLPVVEAMKRHSKIPLDVHLMIVEPQNYIDDFRKAGADRISIHVEACIHLHAAVAQIKKSGAKASIAINPSTSLSALEEILPFIDGVCLMSVNPGFGGQAFIETAINKIKKLKQMIQHCSNEVLIEVDGGVKLDNAQRILDAGADILVSGSGVFSQADPIAAIQTLKNLQRNN
ncbi:MAG: ribulose-phosphate 3-epimerase [Bacteroidetes bacterium]|nr:ribulose-phosphate 3-epimerase [Bacteroidota bacterium]MBP7400122.1 ribulose-phosphate 3-epimerase [Chitinophagales bacterium]MBK7109234.1 ribulose-phosphate 3-epimerase [Bacteroidota bacterium]MBK8488444.1 ribulose-phosphate 3-epimerase [Bacteroidota bacterium]MBK8681793.1 ribulose-phosphate 3-epimerase [Bacteroidota bacterium]